MPQPYIHTTKSGPVIIHPRDCYDCEGSGEVSTCNRVGCICGESARCEAKDCEDGTVLDDECECAECCDLGEELGAKCGCGRCAWCELLRCNSLGPLTLAEVEAREEALEAARIEQAQRAEAIEAEARRREERNAAMAAESKAYWERYAAKKAKEEAEREGLEVWP